MDRWTGPWPLPEGWIPRSIAYDPQGRAVVGYLEVDPASPTTRRVAIAERRGNEWVHGIDLGSAAGDLAGDVVVAVGADGTAAACVTSMASLEPTAKVRHRVVCRPAGSERWEDPVEVVGWSTPAAFGPSVQVAPTGLAVVLVGRVQGASHWATPSAWVSAHSPGGAWTAPQQVNVGRARVYAAQLGLDAAGNATIAWVQRWWAGEGDADQDMFSVRVLTRDAGTGALSAPIALTAESGAATASGVCLAVNPAGAAVLATQYTTDRNETNSQVNATTRPAPGEPWQPLKQLVHPMLSVASVPGAVSMSDAGTAHVLYWSRQRGAGNGVVGMSRCPAGGVWTGPRALSVPNVTLLDAAIAQRGEDAIPVYTAAIGAAPPTNPGVGIFQTSRWQAEAAQADVPTDLVPAGGSHTMVHPLPDNAGSIVLVDVAHEGDEVHGSLRALDRTLPEVREIAVTEAVTGVDFSPDGARLAVAAGPTVHVIDLATGQVVRDIGHGPKVNELAYWPDGSSVATCSDDKTARVTRVDDGNEVVQVVHDGPVVDLAVSRSGKLVTASADGTARVVRPAEDAFTLPHEEAVRAVAISPDGSQVATACADGRARVFGPGSTIPRLTFGQDGGAVTDVVLNHDASRLAAVWADGSARMYDAVLGSSSFDLADGERVHAVAFTIDGLRVAVARDDGTCRIVSTETGTVSLMLWHLAAVTAVAFSPDGGRIVTVTADDNVYVHDGTGAALARLRHGAPVTTVAFQADGTRLATGCSDRRARVYSVEEA